jgi:transcription initiation factor TFIID subunit 7
LKKLTADLETKLTQRDEMQEQQRMRREGILPDRDSESEPEGEGIASGGETFGNPDAGAMEVD